MGVGRMGPIGLVSAPLQVHVVAFFHGCREDAIATNRDADLRIHWRTKQKQPRRTTPCSFLVGLAGRPFLGVADCSRATFFRGVSFFLSDLAPLRYYAEQFAGICVVVSTGHVKALLFCGELMRHCKSERVYWKDMSRMTTETQLPPQDANSRNRRKSIPTSCHT